jgi:hypothetical protein
MQNYERGRADAIAGGKAGGKFTEGDIKAAEGKGYQRGLKDNPDFEKAEEAARAAAIAAKDRIIADYVHSKKLSTRIDK